MSSISRAQIDQLGERLRDGSANDNDLGFLDEYRGAFAQELDNVVKLLRDQLHVESAARIKVTRSIIEKLRRTGTQTLKLSRMQDIAGCRVIVHDLATQDATVETIKKLYGDEAKIIDRRSKPSHGYRAVHVIVKTNDKIVEIQVRTDLQHMWAQISEKVAELIDPEVKYGNGPSWAQVDLAGLSEHVASYEVAASQSLGQFKYPPTGQTRTDNKLKTQEIIEWSKTFSQKITTLMSNIIAHKRIIH